MGYHVRHLRSTLASFGDATSLKKGGYLHVTSFHWISFSKKTLFKTAFCEHVKYQVMFVSNTFPSPPHFDSHYLHSIRLEHETIDTIKEEIWETDSIGNFKDKTE